MAVGLVEERSRAWQSLRAAPLDGRLIAVMLPCSLLGFLPRVGLGHQVDERTAFTL